ncbi:GTP-binding protein [Clavibacter michiganensis]|uniref:GTP-binding protein n=1 Tax=Clavibacter michiganensis TaxID=28447 RepID=UPI0009A855DD|nr:GTP-binding protein [Clavibacter michiganensis]MBF4637835.1 GTP-binding protein [Clavibacter michiganensis subsp. michiganensis]MDO4125397.1 GTP-binding protein [Clavibacter michiganensis]MDO4140026.1 GTP-binding protein [Clavibacter michiganensis]MWJ05369.1 cobalamin biosynthesis protein CobW [Clavibacter michiganensis subsp. michiganensis]MWJ87341.1 cobalamin biosynthesis protein CobW [Clavibacter michiganensis subsp. michiganensis]
MDPHANARPSVVRGGLAVTLVSASDLGAASRVAAAAVGAPASAAPAVVEAPGGDSGDLGADLADGLIADVDDGRRGLAVVALEPAADPLEVALVLEHVVEARHPGSTPIGILDVVAVSSVVEIRELLLEPGDTDTTPFDAAERLAGRLECASVVVLDDLDPDRPTPDARRAVALLAHLAPDARVVATADRASLAPAPLRIGRGRARGLAAGMGWQVALAGEAAPTSAGGMGVHVFRDPRPFHPGRLHQAVAHDLVPGPVGRIVRSRGLVRLATRPATVGSWATAGDVLSLDPTAMRSWDADSPAGQEIAFVGEHLDGALLDGILGACLLGPAELVAGPAEWHGYADPFPAWDTEHRH